ncbi:MAG: tRNA (adenosine(37)-N6)-threonylcarbamoyltransferase complex ATPase subunit type 1 TsaE [Micavibrio sp.]|nr:tRNA (adenosine(37)-N6)-threonylcarbamoyltransferase complex ATPase subunit type 1 TsaE [Micavibrio sp.]
MLQYLTKSEYETEQAARAFAPRLKEGDLIYLNGTLGMGKSVFARALIRMLCDDEAMDVPSPTFTLVQEYEGVDFPVFHYDLYRIEDEEEIFELAWEDALYCGVTIVEWPDRLGRYKQKPAYEITITAGDDANFREIIIEPIKT